MEPKKRKGDASRIRLSLDAKETSPKRKAEPFERDALLAEREAMVAPTLEVKDSGAMARGTLEQLKVTLDCSLLPDLLPDGVQEVGSHPCCDA